MAGTRWRTGLDIVASASAIVAAGFVIWTVAVPRQRPAGARQPEPLPTTPVSLEGAAEIGSATARFAVIEFSDFECPFCGRFVREGMPAIREKYVDSGLIRFSFRHFPLESIHPTALPAAVAAECLRRQGKFWPAHDALFASPDSAKRIMASTDLRETARELGADWKQLTGCRNEAEGAVRADIELAS